jgi:hypothetical protein
MKKLVIIIILFFGVTTNAQSVFNTDNVKLTIYNNLEYTELIIESELFNFNDSVYLVTLKTRRFKDSKDIVKNDSLKINKSSILPIQNILLNLGNKAYNKESMNCLDGLEINVNFSDKFFNYITEQSFSCINYSDEIYKSVLDIFNYLPFNKNEIFNKK